MHPRMGVLQTPALLLGYGTDEATICENEQSRTPCLPAEALGSEGWATAPRRQLSIANGQLPIGNSKTLGISFVKLFPQFILGDVPHGLIEYCFCRSAIKLGVIGNSERLSRTVDFPSELHMAPFLADNEKTE